MLPGRNDPKMLDDTIFRDLCSAREMKYRNEEARSFQEREKGSAARASSIGNTMPSPLPPASQLARRHCYPIQSYAFWYHGKPSPKNRN
jgi:hypothetical protein